MNHDGELDLVELSSLLLKLTGRAPGHAELELSLRELDSDASGTVSLDELLSWWSRKKREETLAVHEAVVSEAPAPAPKQVPPSPVPVQAAKPHSGYQLLSDARNLAASSAETFRTLRSWAVGTGPTSVRVLSFFPTRDSVAGSSSSPLPSAAGPWASSVCATSDAETGCGARRDLSLIHI